MTSKLFDHECTIQHVSRESGLTPRAIRLYEDEGLVRPRRDGRGARRMYGPAARRSLKQIASYRRAGLALADIRWLLAERAPEVRKALLVRTLARRLSQLEAELRETRALLVAAEDSAADAAVVFA